MKMSFVQNALFKDVDVNCRVQALAQQRNMSLTRLDIKSTLRDFPAFFGDIQSLCWILEKWRAPTNINVIENFFQNPG